MPEARLGTKASLAYEQVKHRILDGTYLPGHRLILESISGEMNMSQLPVREALRRLEAEGYVTYKRNAGARVAELDTAAYEATQETIAYLEGAATMTAAPNVTSAQLVEATAINEEMKRHREAFDADAFMECNKRFHDLICKASPNGHLLNILHREQSKMALMRRPTLGVIMRHSAEFIEDHALLLQLIAEDSASSEIQLVAQQHKMRILRAVKTEVD